MDNETAELLAEILKEANRPSWAPSIVTALAIFFSAIVAIAIGIFTRRWSTQAARMKATFDAINAKNWDEDYITARSLFITAKADGQNGVLTAVQKDRTASEEDQDKMTMESAVRLIMNDYELMFIAIENEVIDEELYKQWHHKTIVADYEHTKSYVTWMQTEKSNPNIYKVFQRNAEKWIKEPPVDTKRERNRFERLLQS